MLPPHLARRLGSLWIPFHEYAWFYAAHPTPEEQERAKTVYEKLYPELLFCESCREHYVDMVRAHPPDTSSRDALFRWSVDRHNEVNARLGKEQVKYEDIYRAYQTGALPYQPQSFLNDLQESLTFRERVMLVVVLMILGLLMVRHFLCSLSSVLFCS